LKFSSKGGSFPYTLLFCQLIAFSFVAAFAAAWLFRQPVLSGEPPQLDRRQLFRNYRILNCFLDAVPEAPAAQETPLLAAIGNLRRAQELSDARRHAESLSALDQVPATSPFLAQRREFIRLKGLHALGRFAEFVDLSEERTPADPEVRVLRLDSLLKTRRRRDASREFKALFARQRLEVFSRHLSRSDLSVLLQELSEDDWRAKFAYLLQDGDSGEFRRELRHSAYRDLNRLFQAEFAYRGRAYGQARQLLRSPLAGTCCEAAERLRIKLDVRENPDLDVDERLKRDGAEAAVTPGLLFDLAQLLLGRRDFERALPLYERYIAAAGEQGDEYWKTAWLLAWIHYRRDEKDRALAYFRLGAGSTIPAYRIASSYWQARLEENAPPALDAYPFSYYAVKTLGDREGFKDLHLQFLAGLDDPPGPRFLEIVDDLKALVGRGLWVEATEAVHWAKDDPGLGAGDRNLLKMIESLLFYRQSQYFTAYTKFRGNFPFLEGVRLPDFLSGIFFPRPYEELVIAYSRRQQVDPALVLALIREESFFRSDVRSPANAHGLMQLLHGTARQVANGSRLKVNDLYDPELNIRLGLQYLKMLLQRYDGRLYLALAAYNAGPHRVDQWLGEFPLADEEEFIEMIPFSETRNYVKNILRNYFFYQYYRAGGAA